MVLGMVMTLMFLVVIVVIVVIEEHSDDREREVLSLQDIRDRLNTQEASRYVPEDDSKISSGFVNISGEVYRPLLNDEHGVFSAYFRTEVAQPEQFEKI